MTRPPSLEQIAAGVAGYDPQDMPVQAVADFLAQLALPLQDSESVALTDALGRVLAAELPCPVDVPPHDNAAMDGYAFDGGLLAAAPSPAGQAPRPAAPAATADTELPPGNPGSGARAELELEVVGTVLAGSVWPTAIGPGQALRIMTGAAMPPGLDTVVPQEMTRMEGVRLRFAAGSLRRGANRRRAGEDLQRGRPALAAGQRLGPAALGLVASLGIGRLQVFRRLRVAYFSTGSEVLSLGEPPREGAIYDSNRHSITALLRRLGVEVIDLGAVPDDAQAIEACFLAAAAEADAIISSGGVSAGEADHTRDMLRKLGGEGGGGVFWRVAMRPGRPLAVGRIARPGSDAYALMFGLPGNPVAAMVSFLVFLRPALLRMMGSRHAGPAPALRARLLHALPQKRPGRTEYLRGIVDTAADGTLQVATTGPQGSGVLRSMVEANGLIVLPHGQGPVPAGAMVEVLMFDGLI